MHKLRKGATFMEFTIAASVLILLCGGLFFGCFNKYVVGNKQFVDFNQSFNYAYIEIDGKVERIEISAWKDWKDSDAIQFVSKDGKVYYTHLSRVILSDK